MKVVLHDDYCKSHEELTSAADLTEGHFQAPCFSTVIQWSNSFSTRSVFHKMPSSTLILRELAFQSLGSQQVHSLSKSETSCLQPSNDLCWVVILSLWHLLTLLLCVLVGKSQKMFSSTHTCETDFHFFYTCIFFFFFQRFVSNCLLSVCYSWAAV